MSGVFSINLDYEVHFMWSIFHKSVHCDSMDHANFALTSSAVQIGGNKDLCKTTFISVL